MTLAQDAPAATDADRPDDGTTEVPSPAEPAMPPQSQRLDVRRRLMELRRW